MGLYPAFCRLRQAYCTKGGDRPSWSVRVNEQMWADRRGLPTAWCRDEATCGAQGLPWSQWLQGPAMAPVCRHPGVV